MPNVPPTPVPTTPPAPSQFAHFLVLVFFFFFLLLLFLELLPPGGWSMWWLLHVGWLREWGHSRAPPPPWHHLLGAGFLAPGVARFPLSPL